MFISNALQNAHSAEKAIELINEGVCEGMEGVEFSSDQLAGQHAWACAKEAGYGVDSDNIEAQLDIIAEQGAQFDSLKALEHALKIAENDNE